MPIAGMQAKLDQFQAATTGLMFVTTSPHYDDVRSFVAEHDEFPSWAFDEKWWVAT